MARVLLIQPHKNITNRRKKPISFTPLSLVYLGTAIEDKHEVKIYDRNLNSSDKDFFNFLKNYRPQIIGFTSVASTILFDIIHLGKLIKKFMPKVIILVGGVHATVDPDSLLNESYIDYILRGEGEEAFLEFCNTFDKNPKNLGKLKNINNNTLRPFVDMNKLKLPNYTLLGNLSKYEEFFINLSRGCIGNCTFCYNAQMWGKNGKPFLRCYSTDKAIELFKTIVEKHKRKLFFIVDDNFLFFKERCIKFCNFLEKYNVHFYTSARADSINEEVLKALKKAGCHMILIGIESGSQRMLNILNKGTTVQQNINAIKLCKKYNIRANASIMLGIPTETMDDLKETINFVKKSKPDVPNIHIYNPLPAPLFDYCIDKKLIKKPKTLEEWANFGDVFTLHHNVSEIPNSELQKITEDLLKFQSLRRNIKKFIFWIKIGQVKHALKRVKEISSKNIGKFLNM